MKPKKKTCKTCGEFTYMWTRKYGCKKCSLENKESQSVTTKKRTPVKKVSDKRKVKNAAYKVLRDTFMLQHPTCQVCGGEASEVHHRHSGKDRSKYMNDTSTWMSVCRKCHKERIHEDPKTAREKGWLL